MALHLHVHGGYPSYGVVGEAWKTADWDAFKLVQALKGKPIKGYATLKKANGKWIRIEAGACEPAFELFGEWAVTRLQGLGLSGGLLVPIPSSDCLAIGTDAKGQKLAAAIASRVEGFVVGDALHWAEQLPKAADGGPRDVATLYRNVRVRTSLPKVPIVLIDDVVSTGGHLIACAKAMRYFGYTVEHAICAAQTLNTHPEGDMFSIETRDLEAAQPLTL